MICEIPHCRNESELTLAYMIPRKSICFSCYEKYSKSELFQKLKTKERTELNGGMN